MLYLIIFHNYFHIDIVKTNYTGSIDSFKEVVEGAGKIPVVIAGGEKAKKIEDVLQIVKDSVDAGGAGVAMGGITVQLESRSAGTI